nr:polyprotein [Tolivirales sp.]
MSSLADNVVKRAFKIDDTLLSVLTGKFPGWTFEGHGKSIHPHAVGALERVVCEELAIRDIYRCHPGASIVDIGGNANRHSSAGRQIHSCNPILCPEDAVRRHPSNYANGADYCNQRSEECGITPDVYLAVHSLYYLKPEEVLNLVHRSKKGMLVAVVHKFDNIVGVMHFNGVDHESKYQMSYVGDDLQVEMFVKGNLSTYKHDPMLWVNSMSFQCDGKAMAWNGYPMGDSWILKFISTPYKDSPRVNRSIPLIDCLKRTDYKGDVDGIVKEGDATMFEASLEFCNLEQARVRSMFGFVVIQKTGCRNVLLPKGVIATVASKMVGMDRDSKSLLTCIRYMQSACSRDKLKMNIPPDMLVDCKTYGASLAFMYSMEKEIVAFNKLCSWNNQGKIGKLKQIMRLDGFTEIPSNRYLFGLTALAGSCYMVNKFSSKFSLSKLGSPKSLAGLAAVGIASTYLLKTYKGGSCVADYFNGAMERCGNLVNVYNNTKCSVRAEGSAVASWPDGLPSHTCDRELVTPRDDSICSHPDIEIETIKNDLFIVAPVFSQYIPIVPASNLTNEVIAVRNRGIMKVPSPSAMAWLAVKINCRKHLKFINEIILDDNSFKEWNDKFPPNRRKQQLIAHEALRLESIELKDCFRSTFVKREPTMKGGENFEEFDPRLIQGVSHKANVCLGPFMSKFSKTIASMWNVNYNIFYTCGADAETLGEWREQFKDDDVILIEIDFTRYDAHQGKAAHQVEELFYLKGGICNYPDAKFVFDQQRNTVGFTSKGVFYKVKFTRKSGDPNTSVGNSIVNAECADTIMTKLGYDYKMVVQGDDNLIVIRGTMSELEKKVLRKTVVAEYLKLGFVAKVKVSDQWHDVEFCSSLFWPVKDGYVLGPKIGRRLPKIGFSLKQLTPGQVKGMLLGLMKEVKHIPVLGDYARVCMKLLSHVRKEEYYVYENQYKVRASRNHEASFETYEFFLARYGVTASGASASLQVVMASVEKEFTSILDWPDLDVFTEIDL